MMMIIMAMLMMLSIGQPTLEQSPAAPTCLHRLSSTNCKIALSQIKIN